MSDQCSLDMEMEAVKQTPQYQSYRLKLAERMRALGVNINGRSKEEHHFFNEMSFNDLNVDSSKP